MIQSLFSHCGSLEEEVNYTQVIPSHISAMIVINHLSHDFHPNHTPPAPRTIIPWTIIHSEDESDFIQHGIQIESASSYKRLQYGASWFIKYSGQLIVAVEVIGKRLFESKTLNSCEHHLISLGWLRRLWWFRSHNILHFVIRYLPKTLQTVFSLFEVGEYLDFIWMGLYWTHSIVCENQECNSVNQTAPNM